jgi:hypothetical protein
MGLIARITAACGSALAIVVLMSIGQSVPASAQGGIVCEFGPKDYRNCCKQSYRKHPNLSASKRADDIDGCMNAKPKAKKKKQPAKDSAPKEASPKETPKETPQGKPQQPKEEPKAPAGKKD